MARRLFLPACVLSLACGDPYSGDDLTGGGPFRTDLALSEQTVDFGILGCGTGAPPSRRVTLKNRGRRQSLVRATLSEEGQFAIVGPSPTTIGDNQEIIYELTSAPIAPDAVPGTVKQAIFTVAIDDDPTATPAKLSVQITAGGGLIEALPLDLSFGESPVMAPALPVDVVLRNAGNLPATVALAPPSNAQYGLTWEGAPAPATLAPGATLPGLRATFTPTAIGATTTVSALTVTGPTCARSPAALTLSGVGASSTALVAPLKLAFNPAPCGQPVTNQTITLTNKGAAPFEFTTSLGRSPSLFTVTPSTGTVQPGDNPLTLVVSSAVISESGGIAPATYADALTIKTTAPGDNPHVVSLDVNPVGAVVGIQSPVPIDFGSFKAGNTRDRNLVLVNNGNASALLHLLLQGQDAFSINNANPTVALGSSFTVNVRCTPNQGNKSATITLQKRGGSLCGALPPPIALTCRGEN